MGFQKGKRHQKAWWVGAHTAFLFHRLTRYVCIKRTSLSLHAPASLFLVACLALASMEDEISVLDSQVAKKQDHIRGLVHSVSLVTSADLAQNKALSHHVMREGISAA